MPYVAWKGRRVGRSPNPTRGRDWYVQSGEELDIGRVRNSEPEEENRMRSIDGARRGRAGGALGRARGSRRGEGDGLGGLPSYCASHRGASPFYGSCAGRAARASCFVSGGKGVRWARSFFLLCISPRPAFDRDFPPAPPASHCHPRPSPFPRLCPLRLSRRPSATRACINTLMLRLARARVATSPHPSRTREHALSASLQTLAPARTCRLPPLHPRRRQGVLCNRVSALSRPTSPRIR